MIWDDDSDTVLWLIHSVRKFPSRNLNGYTFPETAKKLGQNFLCITTSITSLEKIVEYLYYTWSKIYDSNVGEKYKKIPKMRDVLAGKHYNTNSLKVESIQAYPGDTNFTMFFKAGKFKRDIYKVIAPSVGNKMYVETWQNGAGGRVKSDCTGETSVYNIKKMKLLGREYEQTQDHSKWAVTEGGYVCAGGLNRMYSQHKRGGGMVCYHDDAQSRELLDGIKDYERCDGEDDNLNPRDEH